MNKIKKLEHTIKMFEELDPETEFIVQNLFLKHRWEKMNDVKISLDRQFGRATGKWDDVEVVVQTDSNQRIKKGGNK